MFYFGTLSSGFHQNKLLFHAIRSLVDSIDPFLRSIPQLDSQNT